MPDYNMYKERYANREIYALILGILALSILLAYLRHLVYTSIIDLVITTVLMIALSLIHIHHSRANFFLADSIMLVAAVSFGLPVALFSIVLTTLFHIMRKRYPVFIPVFAGSQYMIAATCAANLFYKLDPLIPNHVFHLELTELTLAFILMNMISVLLVFFLQELGRGRRLGSLLDLLSVSIVPIVITDAVGLVLFVVYRTYGLIGLSLGVLILIEMWLRIKPLAIDYVNQNFLDLISTSQSIIAAVLRNIPCGVIILDQYMNFICINKQAEQLMNIKWTGQESHLYSLDPDRPLRSIIEYIRINGSIDNQLLSKTGAAQDDYISIRGKTFPISEENNLGIVIIINDLSQEMRLQQEITHMEKLAVAGELAASAAHEIRNPLSSIKGLIQLFEFNTREGITTPIESYLELVLREIDRMDSILNDFLDLSRRNKPKIVPFSIPALIEEVRLMVLRLAGIKNVRILCMLDQLPEIYADPAQLKQVFLNLIKNALDALENGGKVEIRGWFNKEEQLLNLEFYNNGTPIPKEHQEQLFKPFFSTKYQGTGLGLSISRRIIKDHGGTLALKRSDEEGTIFAVTLPAGPH